MKLQHSTWGRWRVTPPAFSSSSGRVVSGVVSVLLTVAALAGGVGSAWALADTGAPVRRSVRPYVLPDVPVLAAAQGRPVSFQKAISDGRPVVLTFMYSSCTTICPVTNQIMTEFVRLLGPQAEQVNVMSLSIDPDYDTVSRLNRYAKDTQSGSAFYTGDPSASEKIQQAFEAWQGGDKMNHEAVFFLRAAEGGQWVRLDGLVSPQRLMQEFKALTAAKK